jgi:hypothetical protein
MYRYQNWCSGRRRRQSWWPVLLRDSAPPRAPIRRPVLVPTPGLREPRRLAQKHQLRRCPPMRLHRRLHHWLTRRRQHQKRP